MSTNGRYFLRAARAALLGVSLALMLMVPAANAAPIPAATLNLTMSNPSCIEAAPQTGMCSLQIRSLSALGSAGSSLSNLELSVNGKLRLRMTGFFESSASLSSSMLGNGLSVPCGGKNAGGNPAYGNVYSLSVNASLTDNTHSSASAQLYCPYYEGKTYLPSVRGK